MSIGPRSCVAVVSVRPDFEKNLYFPLPLPRTNGTTLAGACCAGACCAPGAPLAPLPAGAFWTLAGAPAIVILLSREQTGDSGGNGEPVPPGLQIDEFDEC